MNRYRQNPARISERGNLLTVVVLFLAFAASAVVTVMTVVSNRVRDVRIAGNELVAKEAAQGGVHQGMATLKSARDKGTMTLPFFAVDALDANVEDGVGAYAQVINGQQFVDSRGQVVAEVDVFVDVQGRTSADTRDVMVSSYSYMPSKAAYNTGVRDSVRSDAHCMVRVALAGSAVFDYSYFINHWGWFFGNTIVSNGSVRANGQFDFGSYSPTVNGSPLYDSASGTDLIGYRDDNSDGVTDGSDGGIYSGFRIRGGANVRGMGGLTQNQHQYQDQVSMPNISDLTLYEQQAVAQGGSVAVAGVTYVNGVLGTDADPMRNLYLVGTLANPIVLNGPVVVKGSVILSGYVTGRGTIYAQGNVYIPKDLILVNPPTTWRPLANDEATTEAWLAANASKDALGLFAKEHIVISDYTNGSWQANVTAWVNHPSNKSKEDAGADGIQNTKSGMDGILGTADDDVLEDDGQWTVKQYTATDAAQGAIPPGKAVGDVIPGSGEDLDGDGSRDNATQISEFNIPNSLQSVHWKSNSLGGSPVSFASISTLNVKQVDAVLYTNHALAALMMNSGGDITFNGAIVSRNEAIIYGANRLVLNHDERLNGQGGEFFGLYLPRAWAPLDTLEWEFNKDMGFSSSVMTCADEISNSMIGMH